MSVVVGLTGSIATGKSTAAQMLRYLGVPVFDADTCAHQLMRNGSDAYEQIAAAFAQSIDKGSINRQKLGAIVFEDALAKAKLESILHPKVRAAEQSFILRAKLARRPIVALDVPLLFETSADLLCDKVWLVHCPAFLQKQRAMQRRGMSESKWQKINDSQMPQSEKMQYADTVIYSSLGKGAMMQQLKQQLKQVRYA